MRAADELGLERRSRQVQESVRDLFERTRVERQHDEHEQSEDAQQDEQ